MVYDFLYTKQEVANVIHFWQKHHFSSYILSSQSIWSLHFSSSQFSPSYFQPTLNLVSTVNSLTKNAYMANGLHNWHT